MIARSFTWLLGKNKSNTVEVRSHIIPARGIYLIERSDDNTIKDVNADLIFSGALRNANKDLIDSANLNGGDWPAGTTKSGNVPYASMEKDQFSNQG